MPEPSEPISEIRVDLQPTGLTAVYVVETRCAAEARELRALFADLASRVQVKQLSRGRLLSCAVRAHHSDERTLDDIERVLRQNYAFLVAHPAFDEVIYRIVSDLCRDTNSKLIRVPECDICGSPEPFPSLVVRLADGEGRERMCRNYCARCTAEAAAPTNKEFIRSLLAADKRNFGRITRANLVRRPSRKQLIRFSVQS